MALPVNPPVQERPAPNFMGYSRGTSSHQASGAGQSLFAGLGEIISTPARIADTLVKQHLSDQVYTMAEGARDEYTAELDKISKALQPNAQVASVAQSAAFTGPAVPFTTAAGGNPASDQTATSPTGIAQSPGVPPMPTSLIPQERVLPSSVADLPQTLGTLRGAVDTDRISPTQFRGLTADLAKDLRSQHPGYRQHIDQEFSRVLGFDPANAYVESLTADLNRTATQARQEREHDESYIRTHNNIPNASAIADWYRQDPVGRRSSMYRWFNERLSVGYALQQQEQQLRVAGLQRTETQHQHRSLFTQQATAHVYGSFDTMQTIAGHDNPQRVGAFLQQVSRGDATMSETQATQIAGSLGMAQAATRTQIMRMLHTPDSTGRTRFELMGSDNAAAEAIVNSAMSPFKIAIDALKDKDIGPMYAATNAMRAFTADTQARILSSDRTGNLAYQLAGIKLMHDAGKDVATQFWLTSANRPGLTNVINTLVDNQSLRMRFNTEPFNLPQLTLPGAVTNVQEAGVEANLPKPMIARSVVAVIDQVNIIANEEVPVSQRAQMVIAMTSERGLLAKFPRDSVDEHRRHSPGRETLWAQLTSRPIAEGVWKLSREQGQAHLWSRYVNWVEGSFYTEMARQDIHELASYNTSGRVMIDWDTENMRWNVNVRSQGTLRSDAERIPQIELNQIHRSVERINQNMAALKNIAEAAATNIDDRTYVTTYMVNMLTRLGFTPNAPVSPNSSIPEQMSQSIAADKRKGMQTPRGDR